MKKKNGFTLVELLAVIVILAVILVIAMPKISEVIKKTRLSSLEATTKMIINSAEKKYTENQVLDNSSSAIKCSDVAKLNDTDYGTCNITFDDKGNASVILNGKKDGKFDNLTCSGTKGNITCSEGQTKVQLKCYTGSETIEEGEEYVNGQYTYTYDPEYDYSDDTLMYDGWKVELTDKSSTEPVTTELCSTINDKPVYDMSLMFANSQATSIDLSSFDTSNVIYMTGMFSNVVVEELDLSSFNTNKVINMIDMFRGSFSLKNINLSSFDTSNVINMSGMFNGISYIKSLDLSRFDTSNVTDMTEMFSKLFEIDVLDLSNFDTSKVTNMGNMFNSTDVTSIILGDKWNTSNVKQMGGMFSGSNIENIDLTKFNTSNVTDMSSMFHLSDIENINLSSFDTSKVTNMSDMFSDSYITSLDLSSFDTSKVTNMSDMFSYSSVTMGYAKTCEDAARLNSSSNKPSGLTFTVKNTTC